MFEIAPEVVRTSLDVFSLIPQTLPLQTLLNTLVVCVASVAWEQAAPIDSQLLCSLVSQSRCPCSVCFVGTSKEIVPGGLLSFEDSQPIYANTRRSVCPDIPARNHSEGRYLRHVYRLVSVQPDASKKKSVRRADWTSVAASKPPDLSTIKLCALKPLTNGLQQDGAGYRSQLSANHSLDFDRSLPAITGSCSSLHRREVYIC